LNHRKKVKAEPSRLIPRNTSENLTRAFVVDFHAEANSQTKWKIYLAFSA